MTTGKRIGLSNGRRLVDDIIRTSSKMAMATYTRDLDVSEIEKLRRQIRPKIAWNVLYMKAYAIVALRIPELRQCFVNYPWPHVYEHKHNVCLLTLNREYRGEERLLFARFNRPERRSLLKLNQQYEKYRKDPIEEIKQFRHQIAFAAAPWFVRRFAWWMLMNVVPAKRMSHFGTFGMTLSGYKHAWASGLLGPNTGIMGVDVLPRKGIARFVLTFDHQVIDGVPIVNVIDDIYRTLHNEIATELRSLIKWTNWPGIQKAA